MNEYEIVDVKPQSMATVGQRQQMEIDNQIATAKQFPRSLGEFADELNSMVTSSKNIAASCFYTLPRGGTNITGPSARLAELAASAWGNLAYRAEVTKEDDRYVYATGFCRDLEKNSAVEVTVRRKITNRTGQRFNDDMIAVTANAACSIALRNAILKIVPAAFIDEAFESCKKVVCGDIATLAEKRTNWLSHFAKLGIDQARVLARLERATIKDITTEDIFTMNNIFNAIKNKEINIDVAFPEIQAPVEDMPKKTVAKSGSEKVNLKKDKPVKTESEPTVTQNKDEELPF